MLIFVLGSIVHIYASRIVSKESSLELLWDAYCYILLFPSGRLFGTEQLFGHLRYFEKLCESWWMLWLKNPPALLYFFMQQAEVGFNVFI